MSNSNKLQDDAAKHRGFEKAVKDGANPMGLNYPSISQEAINELKKAWINLSKGGITFKTPVIAGFFSDGELHPVTTDRHCFTKTRECSHEETIKKQLLTSFYHVCKACGEEI
jgi:hypothetical protein